MASTSWTCERCGRSFARRNQRHVCSEVTVGDHLADKPDHLVELSHRFVALVEACGPFEFAPNGTTVGFRGPRRVFAGAWPTRTALRGYLDLPRQVDQPPFRRIDPYTKRLFVHHFDVTSADQLRGDFADRVAEGLRRRPGRPPRLTASSRTFRPAAA